MTSCSGRGLFTGASRSPQAATRSRRSARRSGRGWRLVPLMTLPLLWLVALPVRAESRTAESIWSQSDAQQRAIQQVPLADRDGITQTRCQEVGVGRMGSLPRFRCTVWFEPAAPAAPAPPPSAAP